MSEGYNEQYSRLMEGVKLISHVLLEERREYDEFCEAPITMLTAREVTQRIRKRVTEEMVQKALLELGKEHAEVQVALKHGDEVEVTARIWKGEEE